MTSLNIGDGQGWSFMHGKWSDGPDGKLIPPDGTDVEYLAVKSDEAYGDFTARFRFKFRRWSLGGARFLFRVQDSRRFYALDVPWCGQQKRARYFWAGIVVGDGTPLQRYLNFGLVPGLCAKDGSWYEARVEARGPRLRAWIDGRPVADVEDDTYASGRLGLGGIAASSEETAHFGRLEVDGKAAPAADWPGLVPPPQHWVSPCPVVDADTCQSYANIIKSKSGALTLFLKMGNPNWGEVRRAVYVRSSDAGRTWSEPEPATLEQGLSAKFVREDGTWVCMFPNRPPHGTPRPWAFYTYESPDEGRTWNGPNEMKIGGELPEGWRAPSPCMPVRMHDGALMLPLGTERLMPAGVGDECLVRRTTFAVRSEDDGRTWSAPVPCDTSNKLPGEPIPAGTLEAALAGNFSEIRYAEVRDDVLVAIARPVKDPYMWQLQSNDGGRSWEPAAIGPFPGYCPSLTATAGGALVATTRFPHFAAHLSRDGGVTWDPPVIVDYALWANQIAVLGEPDVVVVSYMGHCAQPEQADSRIARLRVTPEGLVIDQ
ncbi:MAG: exo-alpha-sialidase [Candidatus Brocadiia bacterium]|nr:exo-alpha-sialidase [Candidatus Brocadiia bacterium]